MGDIPAEIGCASSSRPRSTTFPLVRLHIHPPPAKAYALGLESQALLNRGVAGQLDRAARTQHSLPGQSEAAPQHGRHLSRRSWKACRPCNPPVGGNLPAGNGADCPLDSQAHLAGLVRIGLSHEPVIPGSKRGAPFLARLLREKWGLRLRTYATLRNDSSALYSES